MNATPARREVHQYRVHIGMYAEPEDAGTISHNCGGRSISVAVRTWVCCFDSDMVVMIVRA